MDEELEKDEESWNFLTSDYFFFQVVMLSK